jgi:hypothetical protein
MDVFIVRDVEDNMLICGTFIASKVNEAAERCKNKTIQPDQASVLVTNLIPFRPSRFSRLRIRGPML